MFLFRMACKAKKRKNGFHGKLFHRLANIVSSSLLAGRFAPTLLRIFQTFNLSVDYFRANMSALGTIEKFFFFILVNMPFVTKSKNEKLHSDSSTYRDALT